MNHSYLHTSKAQLLNQLVYFDEEKIYFIEHYFPHPSTERFDFEQLLTAYCKELERLVSNLDEELLHAQVLIGSQVKLRYLDDGFTESFSIVFPQQARPDAQIISFLSPIGKQLLLSRVGEIREIDVPSGTIQVSIEEIRFVNAGDFQSKIS
ncbi:GreA/GreB family elongation factor [Marinicrinis lubricantis]|uniref:GreA/GreB family elongation factor n=1 Tax=Marinicrinis lubricantis TaxID=2086470 RepID=A0ABW1IKW7_9BACL